MSEPLSPHNPSLVSLCLSVSLSLHVIFESPVSAYPALDDEPVLLRLVWLLTQTVEHSHRHAQ